MLPKGLGLSVAKAESQHSISFIPLWLSTLKLFTAKQFVFSYIHKAVSLVEHEENSWKRKKTRKKYVKTKKRIPLKLEGHFYSNFCDLPLSWPERRGIHSSEHRISIQSLCISIQLNDTIGGVQKGGERHSHGILFFTERVWWIGS